jgi:tRNA nucleotidyltransferase (CCA-adding enzyme)
MTTEQQLREKLRKITALFEGAATAGERQAAAAAMERVRQALGRGFKTQPLPETKFSLVDQWQRRLFLALCRRHGLEPYRYKGQRRTTVMVRAPQSLVDKTLWPEYVALERALHAYLNEATERIIREEVWKDAREPAEQTG